MPVSARRPRCHPRFLHLGSPSEVEICLPLQGKTACSSSSALFLGAVGVPKLLGGNKDSKALRMFMEKPQV